MSKASIVFGFSSVSAWFTTLLVVLAPGAAAADIIWSGDYETGDFMQWHDSSGDGPNFSAVARYGRPRMYGGDGSLLDLVTSPVRNGRYASRFTVKNSVNGSEPEDCEGMPDCDRRIVALKGWYSMDTPNGTALPYLSERWISVSHYIPADWQTSKTGNWGPIVFEIKPFVNNSKVSPPLSIGISGDTWGIQHRWSDEKWLSGQVPWQQQMFYRGDHEGQPYPRSDYWAEGLKDFPNVAASHAALKSLNKGGWTDWVIHIKFDARGASAGGQGFIEIFKREDSGPWIEVIDIRPGTVSRGGMTFDRGIAYNTPAKSGSSTFSQSGYAIVAGMYMSKDRVWGLPRNRVLYNDNIKIGDENSSLSEMAPTAGGIQAQSEDAKPNPPGGLRVE